MHARDQKPGEEQRKDAATRNRSPSAVTAGTHNPEALRVLQRSAGNEAAARVIGQQRHAHGPDCGHQGQASGSSAGLAVQRWPKGPQMDAYQRPGISNAATDEMLEYQRGAGRSSSPRAEQRKKDLKGDNSWDVELEHNWDNGKRTGKTRGANSTGISRNHRISDHYVGHIIEVAAQNQRAAGPNGPLALQIRTAVEKFVGSCAPSGKVAGIMVKFDAFTGGNGTFRDLVGDASNNGRNLRAGHTNENSTIQEHFDPSILADGKSEPEGTPITKSIMEAVNNLVTQKAIPQGLADEALQAYRGWSSSDIRQKA